MYNVALSFYSLYLYDFAVYFLKIILSKKNKLDFPCVSLAVIKLD